MIKSSIEQLSEPIGYDIGRSDNETQAKLLNGFSRGLKTIKDEHMLDLQICYIVEKLDNDSKEVLLKIADFLKD